MATGVTNLDILHTGMLPPNPTKMLDSEVMRKLLVELEKAYEMVIIDVPPINIVADCLALASQVAGGLFVVRQNYSDHREVRKALIQAEMGGLNLLGFVFYGEKIDEGSRGKYYYHYYSKYDTRQTKHDGHA